MNILFTWREIVSKIIKNVLEFRNVDATTFILVVLVKNPLAQWHVHFLYSIFFFFAFFDEKTS